MKHCETLLNCICETSSCWNLASAKPCKTIFVKIGKSQTFLQIVVVKSCKCSCDMHMQNVVNAINCNLKLETPITKCFERYPQPRKRLQCMQSCHFEKKIVDSDFLHLRMLKLAKLGLQNTSEVRIAAKPSWCETLWNLAKLYLWNFKLLKPC